ncbi:hydantoinase/oxoprolinase family protein [Cognatishimia sp. F0-27]|uniref:hydantoinase/oxoprolinase family protein n=1 Tax=Cognatishimia sp. F0-27 TaxID=2816855 RepID=UPI001D0C85E9|nr:hydantoinase/oxoprolinase family protein [Cognatishimia sp. F0-27]MCC1493473.1 hydantoinase/oxoprolinase family protein [Cognatishimia sp. F0-27]
MSVTDELIRKYEERLAAFEDRLRRIETGGPVAMPSGRAPQGLRLGVDVGGTFTDLLLLDERNGRTFTAKVPSTPEDSSKGVLNGIEKICRIAGIDPTDITEVMHGTTVATNTVLTSSGALVGLVTTKGYRDVLQIARSYVPGGLGGWVIWNKTDPLAPLEYTIEAEERMDAQGNVLVPLNEKALRKDLETLLKSGIEALTVALFNGYANDAHERRIAQIAQEIAPDIPVSTSASVMPEMYEYERTETTVVNSYVRPVVSKYVRNLQDELRRRMGEGTMLQILRSDGGLSSAQAAMDQPVNLLMSGPAGGVAGALWISKQANFKNLLTFDMGGTSTDVALIEGGVARTRRETRVGDVTVRAPSIDVRTVGAGGGSIAYTPELTKALRVGPQSAGATPGPAAYKKGGEEPTVTDANVVLGYLPSDAKLGGDMDISRDLAAKAVAKVAETLDLSIEDAAEGIIRIVNENMVGALRLVSVEQGYDPRDFALIGFGGAGPLHANALARLVNAWPAIVPPGPGVLCAYGDATTRLRNEASQTYVTPVSETSDSEMRGMLSDLAAQAAETLSAEGVPAHEQETLYQIDIRYKGQGMKLTVDLAPEAFSLAEVTRQFDAEHEQLFTFALDAEHEIVGLRAVVQGAEKAFINPETTRGEADSSHAQVQRTRIFEGGGWQEGWIYDRAKLSPGNRVPGPAVVTEMDSTSVILPGHVGVIDAVGNILIWPDDHPEARP